MNHKCFKISLKIVHHWMISVLNWLVLDSKLMSARISWGITFRRCLTANARKRNWVGYTVYPKKYAHGFCFAVLCCGYTLTDFPISIRLTSLALWQSNDCPSASKATLMNMDKYFMWIHYEGLHNHNKAKHNKTVCIFVGIYCIVIVFLLLLFCCSLQYNVTESSSGGVMTYHADFQRAYRGYHVKVTVDRGSSTSCATVELKGVPADGEKLAFLSTIYLFATTAVVVTPHTLCLWVKTKVLILLFGLSRWETTSHCNVVSQWLCPCTELSPENHEMLSMVFGVSGTKPSGEPTGLPEDMWYYV